MRSLYLGLLITPSLAAAYSFNFNSAPRQCQNLSISITGSGSPPYSLLIIPVGPTPLPNNIEARKITQYNFTGSETTLSSQLRFPENSQFVAVMSDSTGFGSGGTSTAVTVLESDVSACFDSTTTVNLQFAFSIVPAGALTQCNSTRIWWDPSVVQGTPSFQGIIPGGNSFAVPQGNLTTVAEQGLGFDWKPSVRAGTTVILTGGDDRGLGTAGSSVFIVNQGSNDCLNDVSPSSTPGSPAGGSYPTSTSGAGTGGSGSSGSNTGAIVGGVIGGVIGLIALVLVILFFRRREKFHKTQKERPVDLLRDDEHEQEQQADAGLPRYYEPEPFLVPDPTVASSVGDYHDDPEASLAGHLRPSTDHRHSRYSGTTSDTGPGLTVRSATPDQSTTSYMRKSPAPPSFRPVNIVQHEDAGPNEDAETIELPPAYTNIRSGAASSSNAAAAEGSSEVPPVSRTETAQA